MKIGNKFYWIVIIILALIIWFKGCGDPVEPEVKTKIEIVYDTVLKDVPVYIPKWNTRVEHKIDTVVDTVEVIKDYYSTYYYQDSLVNDTLSLFINDSIQENKIKSRKINYSLILPTKIITNEVTLNKREIYLGLLSQPGVGTLYKDKKGHIYGLQVGMNQEFKPTFGVSLYWKIK